jgi:hypothetical protein
MIQDISGDGPSSVALTTGNVSRGLGVFSLALGLSEVALTRSLSHMTGIDRKYSPLLRIFGLREITSGLGLLTAKNKQAWMWSRVVGDALDVAFLGWAFASAKSSARRKKIALAAAIVTPVVLLDIFTSARRSR